ncbi:MAG: antibiotic biosynthesis monooxygenase [Opitutaceae bacterium]|nr:antibiotic biosynthesis monooxygenase [Opitutaceae bacterium]
MILEVALLDVKPGLESAFENDFDLATAHLAGAEGYLSHELQRCVENPNRYILLVPW